jgi:3-oxoacyl-[acyl-carrier protein] reductase
MKSSLAGKAVLVTGGSRGIGASAVRQFCAQGASVALHYNRDEKAARAAARGLARVRLVQADLSRPEAAAELWRRAQAWKGRIDVLVNNAGAMTPAAVEEPLERWQEAWKSALQINLLSAADLCREAIRHFRTRRGGVIVNVASRAAFRGDDPDLMHYAASKGGMISLTRSIARGFARDGILAYAVAPGFVDTDMNAGVVARFGKAALAKDLPLGEFAPPEEVARVIVFLASGAVRHATGTTVDVNGASYVR